MVKGRIIPCTKEEMSALIEASIEKDFYYMFFMVAKTTGRRIGELYGNQGKEKVAIKIIGKKIEYDLKGNEVALAKTRTIFKKIPGSWTGGVQVKDIDFENGIMKVWVLKRRELIQDETILIPEVLRIIKHYVVSRKLKPEDYLFREKSYRAIQEAVVKFGKEAKIPHRISVHNFRHYFVTQLKKKGWSNDKISKLTGHKSVDMLSIYDHVVASDIKEDTLRDVEDI